MVKKIGFWVLVCLFIAGLAYSYWLLSSTKKPKIEAVNGIPDNCVFVVEATNFSKLWTKLNSTSLIWQELQQVDFFHGVHQVGSLIDSILLCDETTKSIFNDHKIFLAAFEINNQREYVYALNFDLGEESIIKGFVKRVSANIQEKITTKSKEQILQFKLKSGSGLLYLYMKDGLALFSQNIDLIDNSILSINKNCLGNDACFNKTSEISGTSADFRFYLNNSRFKNIYSSYMKPNLLFQLISDKQIKGWTEIDVDFSPNEMRMSGFTLTDTSTFFDCLSKQAPQKYNFVNCAPFATDNFIFLGLENYSSFHNSMLANVLSVEAKSKHFATLSNFSKKLGYNLSDKIFGTLGNEIAFLRTPYSTSLIENYCMIHLQDKEELEKEFHLLSDSVIQTKVKLNENEVLDSIYYFNDPNLISTITCGVATTQFHYCFFYDDYLVFCERKAAWLQYLDCISKGKTLNKNKDFIRFIEGNISEKSNFFIYSFLPTSKNYIYSSVDFKFKVKLEEHENLFSKFHSVGIQFSSYKGLLLNQMYVLYIPLSNVQNNSLWEVKLDSDAVMAPKIVLNHKTGMEEVFVQDAIDNIYLISNTGKILWKKRIDGRIKSDIFQIDFFNNNKLQLLFNTENGIYLFDRNGNYVTGYPIKLPVPASNGMSVFDYEKNLDYRLVYAGVDKKIYVYKASGVPVDGFEFNGTKDTVQIPIQWERINFKDYLILFDKLGGLYGIGRKGEDRLKILNKIPMNNFSCKLEYGKDEAKTKLYYFDRESNSIVKLFLSGKKTEQKVHSDLSNPTPFFCKINDDNYFDLVLIEGDIVEIYDDQGNLLQKLKTDCKLKPVFKQLRKNNNLYYSFLTTENKLLLYSSKWLICEHYSVGMTQLPSVEMLNDDGYYFIIGLNKDLLSCYNF